MPHVTLRVTQPVRMNGGYLLHCSRSMFQVRKLFMQGLGLGSHPCTYRDSLLGRWCCTSGLVGVDGEASHAGLWDR
jgi:hypothetical protein